MKLSTRTVYGTGAMIELALAYGGGPLSAQVIAQRQGAPVKYLEQVLVDLRRAGLLTSVRGPQGGYSLARSPQDITMSDVYRVTEGGHGLVPEVHRERALHQPQMSVATRFWRETHRALMDELARTTCAQLAEQYRRARPMAGMYYI